MSSQELLTASNATIRHRWRFAIVLLASLLLAVAQPLTAGLFGDQGSFDMPMPRGQDAAAARPDRGILGILNYYSFITLATVGYGDVTPITPLASTLAWMEAIAGQSYLGILVAGLVGFKVAQALKE